MSIPKDILKIQEKLSLYEVGSKNHKKYVKILAKHIKEHNMRQRVNSNIKTISVVREVGKTI